MRTRRCFEVWRGAVRIGVNTVRRAPVLGLKRLVLPVSYWRTAEFAYALDRLLLPRGSVLLDLGSPKDLAVILARSRGFHVVATDILETAVRLSQRYAAAQAMDGDGPGQVRSESQDGRRLTYADDSFDAAFSISVLEHIPDGGDSAAIRELVRVVKPGGLVIGTVPFDRTYRETFVEGPVYERTPTGGESLFFERHYDPSSLASRLVDPSGASLVDLELWGERGLPAEQLLNRLGRVRDVLAPVEPLLSICCLQPTTIDAPVRPMAAFFALRKPSIQP